MKKNGYLSNEDWEDLKKKPILLDYRPETQNTGVGPYFRAHVKKEVRKILTDGNIMSPEGNPYNIFRDGLKIYTTLNYDMQIHAEKAVEKHLGEYLQKEFAKDNSTKKHSPYGDETSREQRDKNIAKAIKKSRRYKVLMEQGKTDSEIAKSFEKKRKMGK